MTNQDKIKKEEGLAGLGERLYSEYEKLPWYKQLLLAIAPVTGETISAYETPIFAEKTKEAYEQGDLLETAGHGALTGLSVLGAIPFLGAGIRGVKAGVKGARKGLASLSEPLNFPAKPSKWWLDPDKDVVTLYHGTNIKNLQEISEKGLRSDRQGFTYLTPDPDTGVGYAVMDQGEKVFRRQGKPKQVPIEERALLEIEVPQKEIISDIQRSPTSKEKLFSGRELFDESERITFRGQEGIPIDARYRSPYYDLTEVRLQQDIPAEWIKGYSIKDNLLRGVRKTPELKGHAKDVYRTEDSNILKHVFNPDEDYAASIVAEARHGPFETVDPVSSRILKSTKKQIYEATQKALASFPNKIKVYRMAPKNSPFSREGVDSFTLDPKFSGSSLPWVTEGAFGPLKKNYKLTEYLVDKKDILAAPNALWKGAGTVGEQEVILRTAKLKGSGGLSGLGEK